MERITFFGGQGVNSVPATLDSDEKSNNYREQRCTLIAR